MENKNKVEEPFDPNKTPNPPQIIEPNNRNQEGEKEPDKKNDPEKKPEGNRQQPDARSEANPPRKLLGESELEVEDETTI